MHKIGVQFMELSSVFLYRMTHIENIPHILKYGITHRTSHHANLAYKAIGDESLISVRDKKQVYVNNGDCSNRGKSIVLGDFIPFYFGVRMPMLYVIQHGGNFVPHATPATDIIYLACPVLEVIKKQTTFYYTNGHATENLTSFFDQSKLNQLVENINWVAVTAKYWSGTENLMLKWQKQAEFLVEEDVAPDCITGFACYDAQAKDRLLTFGIEDKKIKICPNAYF